MPSRYQANPYRVTLDLDPFTSDALTQAAKAANSTRHRLAYEFVQRGLALAPAVASTTHAQATDLDPYASALQRGLDNLAGLSTQKR